MTSKELAIKALEAMRGDDTHRAKAMASSYPLDTEYGRSGRTLGAIIASYKALDAEVDAAIEWVRSR